MNRGDFLDKTEERGAALATSTSVKAFDSSTMVMTMLQVGSHRKAIRPLRTELKAQLGIR